MGHGDDYRDDHRDPLPFGPFPTKNSATGEQLLVSLSIGGLGRNRA